MGCRTNVCMYAIEGCVIEGCAIAVPGVCRKRKELYNDEDLSARCHLVSLLKNALVCCIAVAIGGLFPRYVLPSISTSRRIRLDSQHGMPSAARMHQLGSGGCARLRLLASDSLGTKTTRGSVVIECPHFRRGILWSLLEFEGIRVLALKS